MNVLELRNDLIQVYEKLRKGEIGIDEAKNSANISGKIISTVTTQLEYHKIAKEK